VQQIACISQRRARVAGFRRRHRQVEQHFLVFGVEPMRALEPPGRFREALDRHVGQPEQQVAAIALIIRERLSGGEHRIGARGGHRRPVAAGLSLQQCQAGARHAVARIVADGLAVVCLRILHALAARRDVAQQRLHAVQAFDIGERLQHRIGGGDAIQLQQQPAIGVLETWRERVPRVIGPQQGGGASEITRAHERRDRRIQALGIVGIRIEPLADQRARFLVATGTGVEIGEGATRPGARGV
jgi:hypothetical protein